ncbi:MAG: ABC transporter substrate-binding protein [Thermodesulfobacteriota bacterium]
MKRLVLLILLILALAPGLGRPAPAEGPLETLRLRVDEFLEIMNDPQYGPDSRKAVQRERMWAVIKRTIFFEGVARLAVGKDWDRFSTEEKREFTDAFAELLAASYLKVVQEGYRDEKLAYLGQEFLAGDKAVVRTKVLRQGLDVPVDVKMIKVKGSWLIYDAQVEGVSLVSNFRAQFNRILLSRTPAQLIELMKEKIGERRRAGGRKGGDSFL